MQTLQVPIVTYIHLGFISLDCFLPDLVLFHMVIEPSIERNLLFFIRNRPKNGASELVFHVLLLSLSVPSLLFDFLAQGVHFSLCLSDCLGRTGGSDEGIGVLVNVFCFSFSVYFVASVCLEETSRLLSLYTSSFRDFI